MKRKLLIILIVIAVLVVGIMYAVSNRTEKPQDDANTQADSAVQADSEMPEFEIEDNFDTSDVKPAETVSQDAVETEGTESTESTKAAQPEGSERAPSDTIIGGDFDSSFGENLLEYEDEIA